MKKIKEIESETETNKKTIIKSCYSDDKSNYTQHSKLLVRDARPILPYVAFFIGDIRDGLPMINLQGTYLICLKNISKQKISILFFLFGISQFISMAPCGYYVDKLKKYKIDVLIYASGIVSLLTLLIAIISNEGNNSQNNSILIMSCVQGILTSLVHPLLQSITLGIVGSTGFTEQITKNRTMHHLGTSLSIGSITVIAYYIYPQIHYIFVVSPIAWIGLTYFLKKIQPKHIDADAARGLIIESPTLQEYGDMDDDDEEEEEEREEFVEKDGIDNVNWADLLHMLSNKDEFSDDDDGNDENNNNDDYYYDYDRYNFRYNEGNDRHSDFTSNVEDDPYVPPTMMYSNTALLDNANYSNNHDNIGSIDLSNKPTISTENIINSNNQINDNINHNDTPNINEDNEQNQQQSCGIITPRSRYILNTFFSKSTSTEEATVKAGVSNSVHSTIIKNVSLKIKQSQQNLYSEYQRRVRAVKPIKVLMNMNLVVLSSVIFLFHVSNSAVLPLVMQSLSLGDCREGMLLSGLCIFLAQFLMMIFVKIVGTYSPIYGRSKLFLFGMMSLTIRCLLLSILVTTEQHVQTWNDLQRIKRFILLTQLLDAAGAGTVGMLHILVTCDIAAATGRFALMLGFTNAAMCIGGVFSGYIGTVISQKYGYIIAFRILGLISILPIFIFYIFMPETLPDYERIRSQQRLLNKRKKNSDRKKLFLSRLFSRIKKKKKEQQKQHQQVELNNDDDSIT